MRIYTILLLSWIANRSDQIVSTLQIAICDDFRFLGVLIFIGHIIGEQEVGDPAFLDALHHLHTVGEFPVTVDALCFVGFEVLVLQVLDVFPLVLKIKLGF